MHSDFGDTNYCTKNGVLQSNQTRGLWLVDLIHAGASNNIIDYVTIASTGNAVDFGNLSGGKRILLVEFHLKFVEFLGGYSCSIHKS